MLKSRTTESKYYFANRLDLESSVLDWIKDHKIVRVWFTDRPWMKNTQPSERYEVIVERTEV